MFWTGLIILIIFVIILVLLLVFVYDDDIGFAFLIVFTLTILCILIGYFDKDCDEPQAIDVYRNKTTLQITYQDSIPIDSIVVFKK